MAGGDAGLKQTERFFGDAFPERDSNGFPLGPSVGLDLHMDGVNNRFFYFDGSVAGDIGR